MSKTGKTTEEKMNQDVAALKSVATTEYETLDNPNLEKIMNDISKEIESDRKCPKCETENEPDVRFCEGCGYDFHSLEEILRRNQKEKEKLAEMQHNLAIQKEEAYKKTIFEGIKKENIQLFVSRNDKRYMEKFVKLSDEPNSIFFNFSAFIFHFFWFYYRNMMKTGTLWFLLMIVYAFIVFANFGINVLSILSLYLPSIIIGFTADTSYKKHVIAFFKRNHLEEANLQTDMFARQFVLQSGGENMMAVVVAMLIVVLVAILTFVFNMLMFTI